MMQLVLQRANAVITRNTSFWEKRKRGGGGREKAECKRRASPDYNARALFTNAFLRAFLIGLERKVRGSDPANKNKKRKKRRGEGMKMGVILYAGHHVSLHRSSD